MQPAARLMIINGAAVLVSVKWPMAGYWSLLWFWWVMIDEFLHCNQTADICSILRSLQNELKNARMCRCDALLLCLMEIYGAKWANLTDPWKGMHRDKFWLNDNGTTRIWDIAINCLKPFKNMNINIPTVHTTSVTEGKAHIQHHSNKM